MTYEDIRNEVESNGSLAPTAEIIKEIINGDTSTLADEDVFEATSILFTKKINDQKDTIISMLNNNFEANNLTREQVRLNIETYSNDLNSFVRKIEPEEKRRLLALIFNKLVDIANQCLEKYHNYNIVLPMVLEDGAQVPTYAHDSDAAADIYAKEDITLPANSLSNFIDTGVHIQLPENWVAIIEPRSSIGMKTGLRMSHSQGVVDQDYRGTLGIIYDNISDSDYEIKKGDRIAQMYVMPVYRFKAQVVDELDETERGVGGYGSTGK